MTTIVANGAPQAGHGDGGHRPSNTSAWTDEQTAYALFLKDACVRLEIIAVEIGIKPQFVDDFVHDGLVTIHHARHTQARAGWGDAWIEAIAHNLARKHRWDAAVRGRCRTIFWSLYPFARDLRHRGRHATADVCGGAVGVVDAIAVVDVEVANVARRTEIAFLGVGACRAP